ncbi:MAG: hypothetical protein ACOYBP_02415 [Microbacteriaceae bacterium]
MTTERIAAKAEVESARAALIDHLSQLEEQINLPKRAARATGRGIRNAKQFAAEKPAVAAAIGAAALAAVGGVITLAVRIGRR